MMWIFSVAVSINFAFIYFFIFFHKKRIDYLDEVFATQTESLVMLMNDRSKQIYSKMNDFRDSQNNNESKVEKLYPDKEK